MPMEAGEGDEEYRAVFLKSLVPAADAFKPEFVIVSAGFDAHKDDPLASMGLTEEGYADLTGIVAGIAKRHAGGRMLSSLEGGYHLTALAVFGRSPHSGALGRMKTSIKVLLGCALVGVLVYVYYTEIKPVVIFGLRSDYAHAIPYQKIPEGLTSLKAESCGECHREIYDEWKTSIHAHAYEDPFFQAYWKKDKNVWVCLNCHTPLENQQPTLIKRFREGG